MPHHFSHATTWSPLESELCLCVCVSLSVSGEFNIRPHRLRIMPTCSALSVPSECHISHLALCETCTASLFDISAGCLRRKLQSYQGPPPAHSSFSAPGHMPSFFLAFRPCAHQAPRLNPMLHKSKGAPL